MEAKLDSSSPDNIFKILSLHDLDCHRFGIQLSSILIYFCGKAGALVFLF